MYQEGTLMDELADILSGLEQRINVYKNKLIDLQKKRDRLDDEIKTAKKYLELAETLFRVEKNKARSATPPQVQTEDQEKATTKGSEETKDVLFRTVKFAGLSIPQATYLLLREEGKPLHAKEIYLRLAEGGVKIRSKTPVTSISISLNRDKRFLKIAPNTYRLADTEVQREERR
jgi:hypothetical protein